MTSAWSSASLAKLGAPLVSVAVLVGAVVWSGGGVTNSAAPIASVGGRAWIDDPLDGTQLHPATDVAVVAHASDVDGVAAMELRVDGVATTTASVGGARLERHTFVWTTPSVGRHVLEVRGRDAEGSWGTAGRAVVSVGATATSTTGGTSTTVGSTSTSASTDTTTGTTTAPTSVPSSSSTSMPGPPTTGVPGPPGPPPPPTSTTVACARRAPGLVAPANGSDVSTADVVFSWTSSGCPPTLFRLEWALDDIFSPDSAQFVMLDGADRTTAIPGACGDPWFWRIRAEFTDPDDPTGATLVPGPWSAVRTYRWWSRTC